MSVILLGFLVIFMDIFLQNLENYLRDHHCESILAEEKRENRLCEDSIEYLLNCIREYIHFEYSTNPTPNDIVQVSKTVVELFPSFSSNSEEKIVRTHMFMIIYDTS